MRGFILLIIALLLSVVLLPIGFTFQVIATLFRSIDSYLFQIAKSIDQHGNLVCAELFNLTLIKKKGYRFGDMDKTISYALGRNAETKTLTYLGKKVCNLLNVIEKDHVKKAVEYERKN
jgi:hypothetical protein